MKATQEHYDALAKVFQIGHEGDPDGWEDLAIDPKYMCADNLPVPTRDTLDDFRRAAETVWREAGERQAVGGRGPLAEIGTFGGFGGGLYWERVQVKRGEPRVSLAVIDCGDFRLTYQR